jgi:hypothetical protein
MFHKTIVKREIKHTFNAQYTFSAVLNISKYFRKITFFAESSPNLRNIKTDFDDILH